MSKPNAVVLTTYATAREAEEARTYLLGLDIEAWIDQGGEGDPGGGVRLLVWPEDAMEAADALLDLADDEPLVDHRAHRRRIWITAVAALVAVAMFVSAAPAVLWPPVLLIGLAAFLLWRTAGPRNPE